MSKDDKRVNSKKSEGTSVSKIGKRINELRMEKNMSFRGLARKTGLSPSYLHRIESGQKRNPSIKALNVLSQALGEEIYFCVLSIQQMKREELEKLLTRIESLKQEIVISLEVAGNEKSS